MSIGIWQLLIILAIVLVIFGSKRLLNLGKDLGGAIKGFKQSMKEDGENPEPDSGNDGGSKKITRDSGRVIDAEVTSKVKTKKKKS